MSGFSGTSSIGVIICAKRAEKRRTAPVGFVYLVLGDHPDAVKIGFTLDLTARLAQLQTAMATDIMLAACFRGTVYDERDLHVRFKRYHMRGEWFRIAKPVLAKIESLRRNRKGADLIIKHQSWQKAEETPARLSSPQTDRRGVGL